MSRNPDHLIEVAVSDNDSVTIIQMDNIPEYDIQDYDLLDEKDQKKYIQDIKRCIRGSYEYRQYINYLRENLDMNKCSFYENVTNSESFNIKIEIHHEPLTLEEIIMTIFNKRIFYHESLELELVSKEVMFIHYKMLVGLIPLAQTVHELVHNQYLFIPVNIVMGNYQDFINMYEQFIPAETMDNLERIYEASRTFDINKGLLNKKYIYLDLSGEYKLPKLQEVIGMLNDKISYIRNNNNSNTKQNNTILINPMIILGKDE